MNPTTKYVYDVTPTRDRIQCTYDISMNMLLCRHTRVQIKH